MLIAAVAAALFALGPAHPFIASAGLAPSSPAKSGKVTRDRCAGHKITVQVAGPFVTKVWRLVRWEREKPKPSTVRAYKNKLRCAGPGHRKALKHRWRKAKRAFGEHRDRKLAERAEQRRLDALTPYGAWAIPEAIVMCESGGSFTARNTSSTAGGAYQILDSTWAAYGGAPNGDSHPAAAAPPAEQHEVAARIWADVGSSAWVCA